MHFGARFNHALLLLSPTTPWRLDAFSMCAHVPETRSIWYKQCACRWQFYGIIQSHAIGPQPCASIGSSGHGLICISDYTIRWQFFSSCTGSLGLMCPFWKNDIMTKHHAHKITSWQRVRRAKDYGVTYSEHDNIKPIQKQYKHSSTSWEEGEKMRF